MKTTHCLCLLAILFSVNSSIWAEESADPALTRIAFGSCNRQTLEQPLWEPIIGWRPQLWIWLGDNIYGDSDDPAVLAAKWDQQKTHPGYSRLRDQADVIGTWDDHDYGINNGGKNFAIKADAQRLLLDFLDEPADSPRRKREGVYASTIYGPPGRQVSVILLDVRYFRDAPRTDGDILGEAQWKWLEETLAASQAQVHLIASGTQILPAEHRYEKWTDYPASRDRLLALLARLQTPGVVLLSGDRHFAEISRLDDPRLPGPLFEVTSSGLTHVWKDFPGEPNRLRVGEVFADLHFGTIEVDWSTRQIGLQIRDQSGEVVREATVELEPGETPTQ